MTKKQIVFCMIAIVVSALLWIDLVNSSEIRLVPQPQCVRVYVTDKPNENNDTPMTYGSGTYIAKQKVITCFHVVANRDSDKVEIMFPDWLRYKGKVIKEDSNFDLAMIELDKLPPCKPMPISAWKITNTVQLAIQGYAYGPYQQSWGVLDFSYRHSKWMRIKGAFARGGDSGGPVVDVQGRFVGVLWGVNNIGTVFSPASRIREFIGVEYEIVNPFIFDRDCYR